jgi:hypothetical protein
MNLYTNPIRTISLGDNEALNFNNLVEHNINTNESGLIIQIFAHGVIELLKGKFLFLI